MLMRESGMLSRYAPALLSVCSVLALTAWTLWLPTGLDGLWPWPPVAADSLLLAVSQVWALVAQPAIAYLVMIVLAVVLARRRWRDLAGSVLLSAALTVSLTTVLKALVSRSRPVSPWIEGLGALASFPSGHASASTALAIAVVQASWLLARLRGRTVWVAVAAGLVAVSIWVNRLVLGVHHVSDVLGGALVAVTAATIALALTGAWRPGSSTSVRSVVHVVWHPGRVRGQAGLERFLAREARRRGCPEPVWWATSAADHGAGAARGAAAAGADVIVVVGGDGTLREVLGALAGGGPPVALVAAGSANLMAKNLEVPLDAARAVRLVFGAQARRVDLLSVVVDGGEPRWAATMVGAGADAAVLRDASDRSKRLGGPLGYIAAGRRHVAATPTGTVVTVDGVPSSHAASLAMVGNVGSLHPGLTLLPGADPADGRLDVLVASPQGRRGVLAMIAGVVLGRRKIGGVDRSSGLEATFEFARPTPFQIDGDVVGEVSTVEVTVVEGAARMICR